MLEMVACQCLKEAGSCQSKVVVSCPHKHIQVGHKYAYFLAVDHKQNTVRGHRLDTFKLQVSDHRVELCLEGDHVNKTYRWLFGANGELHIPMLDRAVAGYAALHTLLGECKDCTRWKAVHDNGGKLECQCLECECNMVFTTIHAPISHDATDFVANTHPGGQNVSFEYYSQDLATWKTWLADRANGSKALYANTISTRWKGAKVVLVEMDKVMVTNSANNITSIDGKWQVKVHNATYSPKLKDHSPWEGTVANSILPRKCRGYHDYKGTTKRPKILWNASTQRLEEVTEPYAAVSYVWSEYTDAALRHALLGIAAQIDIDYFWVDRWCIRQDDEAERAEEIVKMRDYYSGAAATVIVVDAIDQKIRGEVESCYKALSRPQVYDLLALADQIANSSWAKRVWTFQEGWVGRNPIIKTKHQCIDAELVELATLAAGRPHIMDDHYLVTPGGINFAGGTVSGGCSGETANGLLIYRTWFGGGSAMPIGCWAHNKGSVSEAIDMARGRRATVEEDYIYGLLAAVQDGTQVEVKYGIGLKAVLEQLLKKGMLNTAMLSARTKRLDECWQPCFGDGIPPLQSILGAMMQWHDGGKVNIAAILVRVDERTITCLTNYQQFTAPSSWTGSWQIPSGNYLLVLPDEPQISNFCLFLTGRVISKFNFQKDEASRKLVPREIVSQLKALEKRWAVR